MVSRYFQKFPIVNYNGFNVVDITKSAMLVNKYVNVPYLYDQYQTINGERADNVANKIYDDSYMTWMIYYANKTIDPYYDWYINDDAFNDYIIGKYGSVETAQKTIKCFINNWFADNRKLSQAQFNNMFGTYKGFHSNYWQPNYDTNTGFLLNYTRKSDNISEKWTNILIRIQVSDTTGFNLNDYVSVRSQENGSQIGSGEIESIQTDNYLILRNNLGEIDINYYIQNDNGIISQITDYSASSDVTNTSWTDKLISDEEYVYWTYLTYYDYEVEKNNKNKDIKLVDPKLAIQISNYLQSDLNQ